MTDIVGPVVAIALIFAVYYIAQNLDTMGARRLMGEETVKLEAEAKLRSEERRIFELQLEREKLLDKPQLPGAVDADYRLLEELEDEREER